ncbi:YqaJ viral recombinase family protein [Clostridium sp.]|uniref:YqaJ viral recombinase family nuclease n=1 Tax=Clostridium sp. TaxID=1506 RepID=UPI002FCA3CEB
MESVAYAKDPLIAFQLTPQLMPQERRSGITDGQKFVKRYYGLQCDILVSTKDLTHEQWLEARKLGITGTDVGGIAGVSKYSTPMKVYLDKVGHLEPVEDNEMMYWGRVMEDVIAKEFQSRNGMKVSKVNAILKHPEYGWAIGNADRLITNSEGEKGILEIKTASEYVKNLWEGEEVPVQYMVQLQWYMFVTGVSYGYFAALIGGNKYVQKYVQRDDDLIEMVKNLAKSFWKNHVLAKNPPMIEGTYASTELLKTLYPTSKPNAEIILPEEAIELIEKREELKGHAKDLELKLGEYENKLKDLLKDNEIGIALDKKVIWKTQGRTSVDSKTLKEKYPSIYEECTKTSTFRKFEIK